MTTVLIQFNLDRHLPPVPPLWCQHCMTCPSQLVFDDDGGNAFAVHFLKYTDVSALLFPGDMNDFTQAPLTVGLQGSYMSAGGGPCLCTI